MFPYQIKQILKQEVFVIDNINSNEETASIVCKNKMLEQDDEPFAIVNLKLLIDRCIKWKNELPRVEPFYAIKCNDDLVILKVLADLGLGFDCASKNEIDLICRNKLVSPEKIIFAHTIKSRSHLEHAARLGVKMMTFDNVEELYKIKAYHHKAKLFLRICVADVKARSTFHNKFGCEPTNVAVKLLEKSKMLKLDVVGIAFHVGSGCRDFTVYRRAMSYAKKLFEHGQKIGLKMNTLDIGGGFPGEVIDDAFSFSEMASHLRIYLEEFFPVNSGIKIIAEPGRYFATPMLDVAVNIIGATKVPASRITKMETDADKVGYMYYLNDGVFGAFSNLLYEEMYRKSHKNAEEFPTIIWGPTCDGHDLIESNTRLRKMNVGDWLFYANMGAYGLVTSSKFNGFSPPKCYYVIDSSNWNQLYGKNKVNEDILVNVLGD